MSTKQNTELIRQSYQAANAVAGDISKVRTYGDKYWVPGYICHVAGKVDLNWKRSVEVVEGFVSAFPDLSFSIDDIVAEGDKVVIRYTQNGTHKGPYMGVPPTGRQLVERGMEMHRIVAGKIVETWMFPDGSWMTQLRAVPDSASKK
jgi:predicted ester cyclase